MQKQGDFPRMQCMYQPHFYYLDIDDDIQTIDSETRHLLRGENPQSQRLHFESKKKFPNPIDSTDYPCLSFPIPSEEFDSHFRFILVFSLL